MTRKLKLLGAVSVVAVSALAASPAYAVGTDAGQTITNTATVQYRVGGVQQQDRQDSDTLTVDRKIDLTVAEVGTVTTLVTPNQAQAATTFRVTNLTNATVDLGLTVGQLANGTGNAPHGGNDNFNIGTPQLYRDSTTTGPLAGVFDSSDTLITYLDEILEDQQVVVHIVGSIPIAQVNGDVAAVSLTAQARDGGTTGTQGGITAQTTGANTAGIDNVFADGAGSDDALRDGRFSARDDYTVQAALLTVEKLSRVISDPVNGTSNPKMIPGATVEYCIEVANATGGQTATDITVGDPLPANVTYVANSARTDATVTSGVCSGGTATGTSFASNTVTGTLSSVAGGTSRGLSFQVTIN